MRVKNDINEIEKVLHLDKGSTRHEGNFIFSGKLNGHYVMIMTESTDEEQTRYGKVAGVAGNKRDGNEHYRRGEQLT